MMILAGLKSTGVAPNNVWVHACVTYDGRGGDAAHGGMKVYINGGEGTEVAYDDSYTAMSNTSANLAVCNLDVESVSHDFTGKVADVAIWSKELSALDVANVYGVSQNGAYRQVRNFGQVSPDNDTRVLGISTQDRGFNISDWDPHVMDQYVQGINVVSVGQLLDYNAFRLRPNSSFIKTFNGRDLPRLAFDESMGTTTIGTGSAVAYVTLGGEGKISERVSHEREQRDLGQIAVYDNGEVFEDTLDLDPVAIVSIDPLNIVLPSQLVCQTSAEMMDGAIEPLTIRERIDGSSIEGPFFAHEIRGSVGDGSDAFRKCFLIVDGWDLDEPVSGSAPFLDSVEDMGNIDLPGAFSPDFAKVEPFIDYQNDRDKIYTSSNVTPTIASLLIKSGTWDDTSVRTYDKMAPHGFIFVNDPIGIDSIAFGGLKK